MVILIALNLLTGMRLGWGYIESWLGGPTGTWAGWLNAIAPKGNLLGANLITLHVTLAFLMFLVIGVYVGYLLWSKSSRRLRVRHRDLQGILTGICTGNFWRNKQALWSANVIVYWVAFAFIFVLAFSGAAIYWPEWKLFEPLGGYDIMRLLHGLTAYLFLPYVIVHVALQWMFGGRFWAIFKAQLYRSQIRAGLISTAVALLVIGGVYAWSKQPATLSAPHLSGDLPAPVLDGNPNDAAWHLTKAVTIRTVKGINNPDDHVDVSLKAVHDGKQIYLQVQWADPDVSAKRFPLLKTDKGWKVLQTAMETANEDVFYEDKLAMYITDVPNTGCAATCHVGVGPDGVTKGVHYTNGEVGDVWHWKSVRTEPMYTQPGAPGHMDDQHFRAPDAMTANPKKRYKAGYHSDPESVGGYRHNFKKLDPEKPLAESYVRPIMLPPTNGIKPNLDPATSEEDVTWWIHEGQGIPYSKTADTYPVGSLIPNILVTPLEGDRADVWSKANWREGRWTLEIRRVLDTKSPYDVAFTSARPVYLSVGTFNRTQTRHSEHIRPVKLVLQP
jgi:hypothetical protein